MATEPAPKTAAPLGQGRTLNWTGIPACWRGQWHTYRGIPLMPTYHPAYLLRNQSDAEKRKVWEDLMAVMEKVGLTISEKQRGYFARGRISNLYTVQPTIHFTHKR